jgi:hypothetical protein
VIDEREQPDPNAARPVPAFRPFPEQNGDGVDLSLIIENLKLSPVKRLRRADRAWRDMLRLRGRALRPDTT